MQTQLQTSRVLVWIDGSLDAGGEHGELLLGTFADLIDRGRLIDERALAKDRNEQVFGKRAGSEVFASGGIERVHDGKVGWDGTAGIVDCIADELGVRAEAAHLLKAGRGGLEGSLRELHFVFPRPKGFGVRAIRPADGRELIDAAQRGVVVGGNEASADAPDVDGRALEFKAFDDVLIQVVAGNDGGFGEPGIVEQLARLNAEEGEVAGIEADAGEFVAALPELAADLDGVADAVQGIVGVHEENAVARQGLGISREGLEFGVEGHDPTVGVRAGDGEAMDFGGEDAGSAGAAADKGCAAGGQSAVNALRAAQAKLDDGVAAGGQADAGGFGGDERLEVEEVEQRGFEELRLKNGALDAQERFVRENNGAFGDRVHVAGETQIAQEAEEGRIEQRLAVSPWNRGEESEVGFGEMEVAEVFDGGGQAGGNGEPASEGGLAKREVEDSLFVGRARLPVGAGHGELVEVGEEGEGGAMGGGSGGVRHF